MPTTLKAFLVAEVSIGTLYEIHPKARRDWCVAVLLPHTEVADTFRLVLGVVQRVVVLPQVLKPFVTRPAWFMQWRRQQQTLSLFLSSFLAWWAVAAALNLTRDGLQLCGLLVCWQARQGALDVELRTCHLAVWAAARLPGAGGICPPISSATRIYTVSCQSVPGTWYMYGSQLESQPLTVAQSV